MNTGKLILLLAKKMNIPKTTSKKIVNFLITKIMNDVVKGNKVRLTGFGIFFSHKRKGRMGRNPQNGDPAVIPAKTIPRFKPGKKFKDLTDKIIP